MRFLHPESSLMQFLGKVADLMLLNVLLLLCSLPVITAGAALTATCKVTQDMVLQDDHGIVKRFFFTFRHEFRQSTGLWLMLLLAIGILAYDAFLVYLYCEGGFATTLYVFLGFFGFLVTAVAIYAFSLLARYENRLKNHLRNACFLMIGKIHRTIPAVILALLPVAVPLFFAVFFIKFIYLWILLAFACSIYGVSYLLKPVLLLNEQSKLIQESSVDIYNETTDHE